jgi:ATP-dependent RNA helicase DDX41
MVMFALRAEAKLALEPGEGPIAMTLSPSRELTTQTHEVLESLVAPLNADADYPDLRVLLVMGGIDMKQSLQVLRQGPHIIAATPGRLLSMLNKGDINLRCCQYLCLDEADRLIDLGFEEDVRAIFDKFPYQRQTVLFSATMPRKIQEFALSALVDPIVVNVGRAGAANMDVIQEVEYVKPQARVWYLLQCLQKTLPPVLVFASNQSDVDEVHEFLLLKGINASAVHGGKSMPDRLEAIKKFKTFESAVLVATDVASKGMDFDDIKHVINYDMPREIEDYVHRIGRTGRGGKTGVATTFINRDSDELTLLDLKHLLKEANQRIPPMLMSIADPTADRAKVDGVLGCAYCDGMGHRVQECPKLLKVNKNKAKKNLYGYDDMTSAGGHY